MAIYSPVLIHFSARDETGTNETEIAAPAGTAWLFREIVLSVYMTGTGNGEFHMLTRGVGASFADAAIMSFIANPAGVVRVVRRLGPASSTTFPIWASGNVRVILRRVQSGAKVLHWDAFLLGIQVEG